MRCVWVEAWRGSRQMPDGAALMAVQKPIDHRLWGRSAWLGVLRGGPAGRAAP